ncbi:MAG: hypothetical protein QQW96_22760 [Tychonema bourrellyi B0820]|uniref:hypothetical protein n=1 Tax=Tychonema bourrellyi TaxID=54313 RepID=UPI00117E76B4|nr:hypothetical protein [Tychonema bourrellyi]MDQ2100455.1 hypothetical protein [Tychonema bourrellyi B0820]
MRSKHHPTELLQLPAIPEQRTSRMIFQQPTTISSQFCPIAPNELKPSPSTNISDRSPSQDVPTEPVS